MSGDRDTLLAMLRSKRVEREQLLKDRDQTERAWRKAMLLLQQEREQLEKEIDALSSALTTMENFPQ